ncbi:hypothetical protein NSK_002293 [Nannochloropsis salina CCMP1776]|uniref:Uncharacterized protein n=1 Tax=Nannochloropsis salina CCMP1776 TaxID=1027361 RepID=A0A4D9DDH1_9STRA|nr:hypothetical protein NSK_002293 [Nannochloropsis salina CCMP1776]|eukprot:TFJ86639.1 hypothetical protein NSK_002293 [Nannochloropsis salina CCMP1776]
MTSRKNTVALAALSADDDEEAEEDEELPPVLTASSVPRKDAIPAPPSLPTDVPTLQKALLSAEGRLVGFQNREQVYVHQLQEKDAEILELHRHIQELRVFQSPPEAWGRKVLVDPGVAMELRLLREKIAELEASQTVLKEDAQARQFSAESATGEALLNKCRRLQQENESMARRLGEMEKGTGEDGLEGALRKQIAILQEQLEECKARAEDLDEERGLLSTMVYALKKQLAAAGVGDGEGSTGMAVETE